MPELQSSAYETQSFVDEFKASDAIAEIKLLDHAQFFEQVHGPIDGSEVASGFGHGAQNFLVRQRMGMIPQNLQNSFAGAGNFP